ncbi:hypothetical protein S245_001237, partial [Arachis hypogaea]
SWQLLLVICPQTREKDFKTIRISMLLELKEGNEMRFFEQFTMRKSVFNRLRNDLVLNYGLKSTRGVSGEKMVATFLYMLGHGASYR